jgi:hypothetical protein
MTGLSRRGLLSATGAGLLASTFGKRASATIMRSVSLPTLVQSSHGIAVVTALSAESHFEDLGRRRRIVTDTRLRVDERLAKSSGLASEVLVRTLGGSVGRLGERVDGQVKWSFGQPSVAFLLQGPDGICYVNGIAQGHYPLLASSARELTRSPDLPELIDFESSAVRALVGQPLEHATTLIRASLSQ